MSTQLYLMGGLAEGRVRSTREIGHLRAVRLSREAARRERRTGARG